MKRLLIQSVSVFLVLALLVTAFGCYGSFNLTTKVYKFNGGLGSKWVNELGFLVMSIVPVYGVAVFVDAIVLNSIEFWTGTNPVSVNDAIQTINLPDGKLVLNAKDKTYEFRQMINGQEKVVRIECTNGETVARDESGTILARSVRTPEGGVNIFDASGNMVSSLTNTQVQSMIASK
jgi:hypothetical protein